MRRRWQNRQLSREFQALILSLLLKDTHICTEESKITNATCNLWEECIDADFAIKKWCTYVYSSQDFDFNLLIPFSGVNFASLVIFLLKHLSNSIPDLHHYLKGLKCMNELSSLLLILDCYIFHFPQWLILLYFLGLEIETKTETYKCNTFTILLAEQNYNDMPW